MEKKPTSVRMLEAFCECEEPYVHVLKWQREEARRYRMTPNVRPSERTQAAPRSPEATQELA